MAFKKNHKANIGGSKSNSDSALAPTSNDKQNKKTNKGNIHNSNSNTNLSEIREDLTLLIITPPIICNPKGFTVVAAVTNTRSKGSIIIKSSKWILNKKEYRTEHREELKASGDSLRTIEELRTRTDSLSEEEQRKLKAKYEKFKSGTKYLRFKVTNQIAEEIIQNESIELSLEVEGQSTRDRKVVNITKEVKLQKNRILQKPPLAPGLMGGNWYFGDTHSHSTYTWDYYFGDGIYTIQELKAVAIVAGLDWLTLTDHAYCLNSKKYETQKNTVKALSDNNFAFLYGEELSCAELINNTKSRDTCHCNGIMNDTFVSCSTDIFRKASSPDSQQGINYLKMNGGLVTINHANWGKGKTEPWNFNINTYAYTHGETGMEILNGGWSDMNKGSTTRWVDKRLLHGEKVFPFAGSDTESKNNLGKCYTVAYADKLSHANIKNSLSSGHHYVTTYPGLAFWVRKVGKSTWFWMGDTVSIENGIIELHLSYSDTTGGLNIYIMKGKMGWTSEQQVYSTAVGAGKGSITTKLHVEKECYLRVYCIEENVRGHRAYTTPIWFE